MTRVVPTVLPAAGCVASVWALAFAYALIRYVAFGPVPVEAIPLYVLNKSLGFSALGLFSLACLLGRGHPLARPLGASGTWIAFAHVLVSMLLFSLGSFDEFLSPSGQLRVRVQLAALTGVVGALALLGQHLHGEARGARWARRLVVATAVVHVSLLGGPGWINPSRWHGGLPPITLLSALLGALALAALTYRARRGASGASATRGTRNPSLSGDSKASSSPKTPESSTLDAGRDEGRARG